MLDLYITGLEKVGKADRKLNVLPLHNYGKLIFSAWQKDTKKLTNEKLYFDKQLNEREKCEVIIIFPHINSGR